MVKKGKKEEEDEDVVPMLLAMLVNDKKLRLMIRMNAIPFSDPLIQRKSDDLSIFTIQHFVKIKQLNEGMVKLFGGPCSSVLKSSQNYYLHVYNSKRSNNSYQ